MITDDGDDDGDADSDNNDHGSIGGGGHYTLNRSSPVNLRHIQRRHPTNCACANVFQQAGIEVSHVYHADFNCFCVCFFPPVRPLHLLT